MDLGFDDWDQMMETISNKINESSPKDLNYPVYCFSEDYFNLVRCFHYLNTKVSKAYNPNLQIFDDLLGAFPSVLNDEFVNPEQCHTKLCSPHYDFQIPGCEYHHEYTDMNICCLRMNLKRMYFFSSFFNCNYLNFNCGW